MSTQRDSVTPHPIKTLLGGAIPGHDNFLAERRKLVALKIKAWFEAL